MYSLASARTSLVGAKSSRRSVARASRAYFSRCARRAASEALGEAVVMLTKILPHYSILLQPPTHRSGKRRRPDGVLRCPTARLLPLPLPPSFAPPFKRLQSPAGEMPRDIALHRASAAETYFVKHAPRSRNPRGSAVHPPLAVLSAGRRRRGTPAPPRATPLRRDSSRWKSLSPCKKNQGTLHSGRARLAAPRRPALLSPGCLFRGRHPAPNAPAYSACRLRSTALPGRSYQSPWSSPAQLTHPAHHPLSPPGNPGAPDAAVFLKRALGPHRPDAHFAAVFFEKQLVARAHS